MPRLHLFPSPPRLVHGLFCACSSCAVVRDPIAAPRQRRRRQRVALAMLGGLTFAAAVTAPAVGLALAAVALAHAVGLIVAADENPGARGSLSARHIRRGRALFWTGYVVAIVAGIAFAARAAF